MSSIIELPLSGAVDESNRVAGWDETIDGASWQDSNFRGSMATHAMAHQSVVCGTKPHGNTPNWISWTTSFAPHRVCRVASNRNGSVIAVTTDAGTVSILRGLDGTVIATRRVTPEGVRVPAEISFVGGSLHEQDTLVIEPPEDGPPILVSNIDGARLNSTNPGTVSEAARIMSIHALILDGIEDIRGLRGFYITKETIRFALIDGEGSFLIYDYAIQDKCARPIKTAVSLNARNEEDKGSWELDFEVGLKILEFSVDRNYILLTAYAGTITKICWFDILSLKVTCEYKIPPMGHKRPQVLDYEPLSSCSKESCVAIAVATKPAADSSKVKIEILQALAEYPNDGLSYPQPHILYTIPMPDSVQSLSIASIASQDTGPYSFRCKSWFGNDIHKCTVFCSRSSSQDGSGIGSVRLLLSRRLFDQAYQVAQNTGMDKLINDPFANFHPSEISLHRLKSILLEGNVSSERSIQVSRESLHELSLGAISGDTNAEKALLQAADIILRWPEENSPQHAPSVHEIVVALAAFIATMSSVAENTCSADTDKFNKKKAQLEEKFSAIKYLEYILEDAKNVYVVADLISIQSPKELFCSLVQKGYFLAAEQMWRSELRPNITTETMVAAVLGISSRVNPGHYATLLQEIIFPSLTINHELLPHLLDWSCRLADEFDENPDNGHSLDEAIVLLEIVERATRHLRIRVHASFAEYAPFVNSSEGKRDRISPSKSSAGESMHLGESFFSIESSPSPSKRQKRPKNFSSSPSIERPNPTILELGQMKLGAKKSRLGQVTSVRMDAIDASEECVEVKLHFARLLKKARILGLDRHLVYLRTCSSYGGASFLSKELVRSFSRSASKHEDRLEVLSTHVKQFCEQAETSLDEALLQYTRELCTGKTATASAIQECASIASCCCAAGVKCQVTLIALRAALFCRYSPSWLSKLSLEAIEWASTDSSLRSELEEASRLLLIDGIVGRYCGEGAKELFHVDNPRHAVRLLEFVCQHIHSESVLSDALDLCEAFTHLSPENACSLILQNSILQGDQTTCYSMMKSLYSRNTILANTAFARVVSFCFDLIDECSFDIKHSSSSFQINNRQKQAISVTSCACEIIPIALAHVNYSTGGVPRECSPSHFEEGQLEILMQDLDRIRTLQIDHSIFPSMSDLHRPKALVDLATKMFDPIVESYLEGNPQTSSTIVTRARRACSLLAGSSQMEDVDLWYAAVGYSACDLAWKTQEGECVAFLCDLGVLESIQNGVAARACLAVALSLCLKASHQSDSSSASAGMKHVIRASSLLQDNALLYCPDYLLGPTHSLGELADIVSQVLVRTDEGIGERLDEFRKEIHTAAAVKNWAFAPMKRDVDNHIGESLRIRRPALHPTWYVGDGLLLPPEETLSRSIQYCKYSMGGRRRTAFSSADDTSLNLHHCVESRGAHALTLRLLCNSIVTQLCTLGASGSLHALSEAHQQASMSLAERYLGGAGNGITSGVVDSQLAVSFLLCLPLKLGFKVYRSSLPTAINTRDFQRVVALANVGKVTGSGELFEASNTEVNLGWKRQHKFVAQCELLASRAVWWDILQRYKVKFDPRRFDDNESQKNVSRKENKKEQVASKYATSLVPSLINNLSKTEDDPIRILDIVSHFSNAFDLSSDLAIERYIEYLLSPIPKASSRMMNLSDGNQDGNDIRLKLNSLESTVRNLLRLLDSPMKRPAVLRKCVVALEESNFGTDYERLAVILSLYHAELGTFISQNRNIREIDPRPFKIELELIDRRRDALALLSSFFQGERKVHRPSFIDFFVPLSASIDSRSTQTQKIRCSILGDSPDSEMKNVDPLKPLDRILHSHYNVTATAALAPLCLSLGVPRGYIHARSLIARFCMSVADNVALPSFDTDVYPVVNRLKTPADRADLAEFCSSKYNFDDEDKLKCLDLALNFAMQASSEAERISSDEEDEIQTKALDRVKRISSAKDLLADRLSINTIIRSGESSIEQQGGLLRVVDELMRRLEVEVWSKEEFVPEQFMDVFLSESSLLAAVASLSSTQALSMGQFRVFSMLVHRTCKSIADKYSHIQVGSYARRLTCRWLFHGDHHTSEKATDEMDKSALRDIGNSWQRTSTLLPDIEEDDTVNFVMDLASLRSEDNMWTTGVGPAPPLDHSEQKLTSEEEPSSLKLNGSAREYSELACRRTALRIAFVMAFADGYYTTGVDNDSIPDENSSSAENHQANPLSREKQSRSSLLSRTGSRDIQNDAVMEHSRELLHIVFAKSGGSDWLDRNLSTSFDSRSVDNAARDRVRRTITFAMRHRALRAASILCPQDALEDVLRQEGYIGTGIPCNLKKCSFGAFVAKEIEEMGLPLPHSDLAQLSTMHFPSYARALWRHHRDGDLRGSRGRLLLLILEMYVKDKVTDVGFVVSILNEMNRLKLPRTLLLACECLGLYKERMRSVKLSSTLEITEGIMTIIPFVSEMVISELRKNIKDETFGLNETSGVETVSRLGHVVQCFCEGSDGQRILIQLIEGILGAVKMNKNSECVDGLCDVVCTSVRRIEDKEIGQRLRDKISKDSQRGNELLQFSSRESVVELGDTEAQNRLSLSRSLDRLESSLNNLQR